jgi:phosphoribosylformylglycinamidine cyclo-ligase
MGAAGTYGFLQAQGNIEPAEMARTFNCGVGMVLAVEPANVEVVRDRLEKAGEPSLPWAASPKVPRAAR